MTATFHWWKDKNGRHVECTSANATYSTTDSHVEKKYLETEKKNDSYAIGKASAIVKYHFYRSDNPFAYVQESFKITCTDDGTIKDNIG